MNPQTTIEAMERFRTACDAFLQAVAEDLLEKLRKLGGFLRWK